MSNPNDASDLASPLDSPSSPTSPDEATASPPINGSPASAAAANQPSIPSLTANMTASSTPRGALDAARRPPPGPSTGSRGSATALNPDFAAKMKAFSISRQTPQINRGPMSPAIQSPGPGVPGFPSNFKLPPQLQRPIPTFSNSAPIMSSGQPPGRGLSLAEKRGMKLPGGLGGPPSVASGAAAAPPGRQRPKMRLSDMGGGPANGDANGNQEPRREQTQMDKYADFVDTKTGALTFKGKATVHGDGIDFTTGKSFSISLDEVDTVDELGKGNYGTVYKVRHARPRFRRQGQGLAGNKARGPHAEDHHHVPPSPTRSGASEAVTTPTNTTTGQAYGRGGFTGITMAMKEMRLELDDAKLQTIIMELDILHRCVSEHIIDFYGAFFQEGAVYICMEYMDGGSMDKLYGDGVPEFVLRKITLATTLGLKYLKEEHNIIHRDVKPTNILINTHGRVKICDFGVSGNLVASIARTNIGCQSYMAPERISSGSVAPAGGAAIGTYSVQSDIWSLGLTIIECALGRYPYPPETYDNIFSQLAAIVDGDPPDLPADDFSIAAHDFVAGCLNKIPNLRPTYPMLLQHAWLAPLIKPETIVEEDEEAAEQAANEGAPVPQPVTNGGDPSAIFDREVGDWVVEALERRRSGQMAKSRVPALHTAPLDAVTSPSSETKIGAGAVAV